MGISDRFLTIKNLINNRARLIAVSKNQADEKIAAALDCSHRVFGENRVQEAVSRWQNRRASFGDLELHLIGPLQTNKAKDAVALFDVIETVDRKNLVDALAKEELKQGRKLEYFIQVNTGDEIQKAGVEIQALPELLAYARERNLNVTGLMCIPPADGDPAPHFKLLAKLAEENGLAELSMGMSEDFEAAIECGATFVRVGTALFGER